MNDTGFEAFAKGGVSRRDFIKVCSAAAAAVGLPAWAGEKMAENAAKGKKPSVVWLHFQECTGCTESLLRTSHPAIGSLLRDRAKAAPRTPRGIRGNFGTLQSRSGSLGCASIRRTE